MEFKYKYSTVTRLYVARKRSYPARLDHSTSQIHWCQIMPTVQLDYGCDAATALTNLYQLQGCKRSNLVQVHCQRETADNVFCAL